MALLKSKVHRGQTYEYWGWVFYQQNKLENTTTFAVGAFKDLATRQASISNEEPSLREVKQYSGLLTVAQCYEKFKASNAHRLVFQNAKEEILDDDGNIVSPAAPEIAQDVENTNWFTDAEDI